MKLDMTYKLASSEGLNKQINRMIRFNTLKNFLFNGDSEYINSQKSLFKKMEDKLQKNLIETIENSLNQIEEDRPVRDDWKPHHQHKRQSFR